MLEIPSAGAVAAEDNPRPAKNQAKIGAMHRLQPVPVNSGKLPQPVLQIVQRPRPQSTDRRCDKRVQVAAGEIEEIQAPHHRNRHRNYPTLVITVSSSAAPPLRQDIQRCQVHVILSQTSNRHNLYFNIQLFSLFRYFSICIPSTYSASGTRTRRVLTTDYYPSISSTLFSTRSI